MCWARRHSAGDSGPAVPGKAKVPTLPSKVCGVGWSLFCGILASLLVGVGVLRVAHALVLAQEKKPPPKVPTATGKKPAPSIPTKAG